MLWFTVWTVLVAGALVGGFLLVRHVVRSGRALLEELARAGDAAGRLADRVEELADTVAAARPVAPVDLRDPEPARERLLAARGAARRRRAARDDRRAATFRRWLSFSR